MTPLVQILHENKITPSMIVYQTIISELKSSGTSKAVTSKTIA